MAIIEERQIVLESILDDLNEGATTPIYERLYSFYRDAFDVGLTDKLGKTPGLVVCMARKSWCLSVLFRDVMGIRFQDLCAIHDKMLSPWFNGHPEINRNELKVSLIDDTYLTGRAVDNCLRRLVYCYGVKPENITLYIFAMQDRNDLVDNRRKIVADAEGFPGGAYQVASLLGEGDGFFVRWGGHEDTFCSEKTVRAHSLKFVEAIHACGEPYVANMSAFTLTMPEAEKVFGACERSLDAYLTQERLRGQDSVDFSDPAKFAFHNITTNQMYQWGMESFTLTPLTSIPGVTFDWLPTDRDALSFCSLRFIIHRKLRTVIFMPYISLKTCALDADLTEMFPASLRALFAKGAETWSEPEGLLAAHRMLRYAAGYVWGKKLLDTLFGVTDSAGRVASHGGIRSQEFFHWLNDEPRVTEDLRRAWRRFTTPGFTVSASPMKPDDETLYREEFDLAFNGKTTDYRETALAMFRAIMEQERMQNRPIAFRGVPVEKFAHDLSERFALPDDEIAALIFMLCDTGATVTQVYRRDGAIGTYLVNGEQSCHAMYHTCPSYAYFLNQLLETPGRHTLPDGYYQSLTQRVRGHFEQKAADGGYIGLAIPQLLKPIADIQSGKTLPTYYALERPDAYDSSSDFFYDLWDEYQPSQWRKKSR